VACHGKLLNRLAIDLRCEARAACRRSQAFTMVVGAVWGRSLCGTIGRGEPSAAQQQYVRDGELF